MNKYYTPDISEFYIGFEYEWSEEGRKIWIEEKADQDDVLAAYASYEETPEIYPNEYRVKYLEREDIESLRFIKTVEDVESFTFQQRIDNKAWLELTLDWDEDKAEKWNVCIEYWYENLNSRSNYSTLFRGTIKNKSELIRLLKQLGYDNEV